MWNIRFVHILVDIQHFIHLKFHVQDEDDVWFVPTQYNNDLCLRRIIASNSKNTVRPFDFWDIEYWCFRFVFRSAEMYFKQDLDKMKQMADENKIIDGIFKPMKNAYSNQTPLIPAASASCGKVQTEETDT